MESTLKRTWAEIDLDALGHNYRALRAQMGPRARFLGVVKADSYGHGAVHISRELEALGCDIRFGHRLAGSIWPSPALTRPRSCGGGAWACPSSSWA